jgi:hypothetical protein
VEVVNLGFNIPIERMQTILPVKLHAKLLKLLDYGHTVRTAIVVIGG